MSGNFSGTDGDLKRRDDLAVYEPDTGNWFILTVKNELVSFGVNWGWNETNPAPGDYDGDGVADLAVYHRQTGGWYIKTLAGNLLAFAEPWGDSSMISVPADYNGDGRTDLGLYQPSTGNWFVRTLDNQLLLFGENWGGPDMVPVPGDYTGDGRADLAVYQRHTGNWFIKTLGNQVVLFGENWGSKEMVPVPGDYNGNGKFDLAVYQRTTGNWFIRTVENPVLLMFGDNWGWNETQPVAGDFNGDGQADLAVYHRSSGNWFIRTMNAEAIVFSKNWGIPAASTPTQVYAHRGSGGYNYISYGDSITFGRGSASNGPATGYPILLEMKLDVYFGGMFQCFNLGNPGETTFGGLNRLPSALNAIPHADSLLLMQGTNDALSDSMFDRTDNNLSDMLMMARNRGLSTYLSTIPPVTSNASQDRSAQAARIRRFNPFIYTIANNTGSKVVQTYEKITAIPNWPSLLMNSSSPNHPNDAGYLRIRDAFFEAVRDQIHAGQ